VLAKVKKCLVWADDPDIGMEVAFGQEALLVIHMKNKHTVKLSITGSILLADDQHHMLIQWSGYWRTCPDPFHGLLGITHSSVTNPASQPSGARQAAAQARRESFDCGEMAMGFLGFSGESWHGFCVFVAGMWFFVVGVLGIRISWRVVCVVVLEIALIVVQAVFNPDMAGNLFIIPLVVWLALFCVEMYLGKLAAPGRIGRHKTCVWNRLGGMGGNP